MEQKPIEYSSLLRSWRKKRNYTQMELALELGVSTKHLSFVETGRAIPSRDIILRLHEKLQFTRSDLNHILQSAGLSPEYLPLSSDDTILNPVIKALDIVMDGHMPSPGFVFDTNWDLITLNPSAKYVLNKVGLGDMNNLIASLQSPKFDRSIIKNFDDLISAIKHRVKNDLVRSSDNAQLSAYSQLLPGQDKPHYSEGAEGGNIVFCLQIEFGEMHLDLYTLIVELGAVNNVVGTLKTVLFFPANKRTKDFFQQINNYRS